MQDVNHIEITVYLDVMFFDISMILFYFIYGLLIYFLYKQRNKMEREARPFLISLSLYFLFELIGNALQYNYRRDTVFGLFVDVPNYELMALINLIGLLFVMIGPIYLIYIIEERFFSKSIIKDRHMITILQILIIIVLTVLMMIVIYIVYVVKDLSQLTPLLTILMILWLLILGLQISIFVTGFLFLGIKSSGDFRKYSFTVAISYFARGVVNVFIAGTANALVMGNYPSDTSTFFIMMGLYMYMHIVLIIIMFISLIKLYRLEDIKADSEEAKVLIEKFIRPKRITAEEVIFYKEQKICMVCKGKAKGFNIYVCTTCDGLYCKKCAEQLTNLENACWSCNAPFDPSKPSTPFKKEELVEDKEKSSPHKSVKP